MSWQLSLLVGSFERGLRLLYHVQVAQGFGLLLGTLAMNPKTAQTIASIVVLAFTLVGGYFVKGE